MVVLRLFGWVAVAVVVATSTLAFTAGTARACSCAAAELSDYADNVSVAFVGSQLERVVHDYDADNGVVLLFSVDRVYKGEAGSLIEVRTRAQGSACGVDLDGRGSVGVAAEMRQGELSVHSCGSIVTVDALEEVFGQGYPPGGTQQAAPETDGSALDPGLLAGLVVAGAGAAIAVAAVVRRRLR